MALLEQSVSARFKSLDPTFDEKSRRLWAAAEALSAGRGGIVSVHRATGISRNTIYQGMRELEDPAKLEENASRTRTAGGGRKKTVDTNPELRGAL